MLKTEDTNTLTMAVVSVKKTPLGKNLVLVEKEYDIVPEIFTEIMSYFAPPVEDRLWKMSVDKLHALYRQVFRQRISNMKCSTIPLEKRKNHVISRVMKYHLKNDLTKKYLQPVVKDFSMFSVGDKINKYGPYHGACLEGGIIVKITDSRLHIQMYHLDVVNRVEGDLYVITTYCWGDRKAKKIIVLDHGIKKVDSNLIVHEWYRWN